MSGSSKIEWTGSTWNPIVGCSKVSEGCRNCYAINQAYRNAAMAEKMPNPGRLAYYKGLTEKRGDRVEWTGKVNFVPEALEIPLKTRKPTKWFVNSMSDLFHESVTDEQLDQIFAVIALTPQHIYQVLTKRPERMLEYFSQESTADRIRSKAFQLYLSGYKLGAPDAYTYWLYSEDGKYFTHYKCPFPLINVWLGVTVENQKAADERIPLLLQTPAVIRFLSIEPLLEEVNIGSWLHLPPCPQHPDKISAGWGHLPCDCRPYIERHVADGKMGEIDWTIVGGESGRGARPCNIEWIRAIVQQCKAADVPVFVKQLGSYPVENRVLCFSMPNQAERLRVPERREKWIKDRKGGDINEFPEDLRVREFPKEASATARSMN